MFWSTPAPTPLEKTIVLIVPAPGMNDQARLRASLITPGRAARVILCLSEDVDPSLAASLASTLEAIRIETQTFVHAKIENLGMLQAPPEMSRTEQIQFAFAFSDVVLIADSSRPDLKKEADKFHKKTFQLGEPFPVLLRDPSVADDLDPRRPGWLFGGPSTSFGRLEQAILELFAFCWLGWNRDGFAESTRQLKRCFQRGWTVESYFAPDGWRKQAPDQTAVDESSSPLVRHFETMDRSALYGSYVYRDLIWITHFLAAFAVLAAVAGTLVNAHSSWVGVWGVSELVALLLVVIMIFAARTTELRDRWTACRLGAEQLRIARMALPLLVLPRALSTVTTSAAGADGNKKVKFDDRALEEVKRAVREHGLPRLAPRGHDEEARAEAARSAARWVRCIVADQVDYHHRNHEKLEHVENWITYCTEALFIISLIAVVRHLWSHEPGLLLFTAAGPAFGAALHGAGVRLGIVHRATLSAGIEKQLRQIDASLGEVIDGKLSARDAEAKVRGLAADAAEAMGIENTSWHGLVRSYKAETFP